MFTGFAHGKEPIQSALSTGSPYAVGEVPCDLSSSPLQRYTTRLQNKFENISNIVLLA